MNPCLPLFYEEPDPDRWIPGDRYPRRMIRRLVRGPTPVGGQRMVFLNLCAGLDELGVRYRINDFSWARRHPDQPVGIVGKPHVLDRMPWRNPILFGASVMSHPLAAPAILDRHPIRRILVPGPWMQQMCEPLWGSVVRSWPVGIDTNAWHPAPTAERDIDLLLYDKVRWEHDRYKRELLDPIDHCLQKNGLRTAWIRYGGYRPQDLKALLARCRAMVFLCEHETQGLAYQQALACDVPILAWDRGGYWQDPEYYPARVRFAPVTSVPYWDERCGAKFLGADDFPQAFDAFWARVKANAYAPRQYVMENLTLRHCAQLYLNHWRETFGPANAISI